MIQQISDSESFTKFNEGCTLEATKDSEGWEIGWGHNAPDIVEGLTWTQVEADTQFDYDHTSALRGSQQILGPVWAATCPARQAAFIDLVYELGAPRFEEFVHAIAAALRTDWETCAIEVENSKYAQEVPRRCARVCALIREGNWQALESLL